MSVFMLNVLSLVSNLPSRFLSDLSLFLDTFWYTWERSAQGIERTGLVFDLPELYFNSPMDHDWT